MAAQLVEPASCLRRRGLLENETIAWWSDVSRPPSRSVRRRKRDRGVTVVLQ